MAPKTARISDSDFVWVRSHGLSPAARVLVLLFGSLAIVVEGASIAIIGSARVAGALELDSTAASPGVMVVAWTLILLLPVLLVLTVLSTTERSLGVGATGLRLKYWLTHRDFAWTGLRPWSQHPPGDWAVISGTPTPPLWMDRLSGAKNRVTFWVTRDQAAAIFRDPKAPTSEFPPAMLSWARHPGTSA